MLPPFVYCKITVVLDKFGMNKVNYKIYGWVIQGVKGYFSENSFDILFIVNVFIVSTCRIDSTYCQKGLMNGRYGYYFV
ncbi:hypothetical protein GCM10027286_03800 [Virgibacillus ainsalahensis]